MGLRGGEIKPTERQLIAIRRSIAEAGPDQRKIASVAKCHATVVRAAIENDRVCRDKYQSAITAGLSIIADALFESRGIIGPAAESLGMPRPTLSNIVRSSDTLLKVQAEARELALDRIELALLKKAEKGSRIEAGQIYEAEIAPRIRAQEMRETMRELINNEVRLIEDVLH